MDFSALQAYVTVCEEGKMTLAAEKLFMSKQTLSMVIKRIEGEVGARLLIRSGSGIEMTPEGKRFLEYARKLLYTWDECRDSVRQIQASNKQKLRIGFGYMCWNLWTKARHECFQAENPDIELDAFGELSRELLVKLDKGQLDAVITCMQTKRYEQYDVHVICDMRIEIQMTQDDPLAQRQTLTPWDLDGRKIVYPDSGENFLKSFCGFLSQLGIRTEYLLLPAGNFLRELGVMQEERALRITNSVYRSVSSRIDGFVSRPLVYEGETPMPHILLCALMPREQRSRENVLRFAEFLRNEISPLC